MMNRSTEQQAKNIINQVITEQKIISDRLKSGRIYTIFDYNSDVVENYKTIVNSPLWSNKQTTLSEFYTGSEQNQTSSQYYFSVYQTSSDSPDAVKQFDIAYGHKTGLGSYGGGGDLNDSPSKAIYSQWKQRLLEPGDNTFTFGDSNSDSIYVISLSRARYKERIDPGNFELHLSSLNGSSYSNETHTGSNISVDNSGLKLNLIDDSGDADNSITLNGGLSRVYKIRSGSINDGIYTSNSTVYGLFYPEEGTIILNGDVLDVSCSFNTTTASNMYGDNIRKLYVSISGSGNFEGRSSETINSSYYYVRVKNSEYNYSTNETFVTGSSGDLKYASFIKDPQTYITSIGLYNDRQELLAVAKLNEPLKNNFTKEYVIKCKLDW